MAHMFGATVFAGQALADVAPPSVATASGGLAMLSWPADTIDLGDTVVMTVGVKDPIGNLANAITVSCVLTLPDGTTVTLPVQRPSTGVYMASWATSEAGRIIAAWTATGGAAGSGQTYVDVIDVDAPSESAGIVSLAATRRHLAISASDSDAQLRSFIATASDTCERYTGRIWRLTVVTEVRDGGPQALALWQTPVQSIISVTQNTALLSPTEIVLDQAAGVLRRGTTRYSPYWYPGYQNIVIVYLAGPTTIPAPIRQGVLEMVRHLWESQRGNAKLPSRGSDNEWDPRTAFSVPKRVAELWDPYCVPGFA